MINRMRSNPFLPAVLIVCVCAFFTCSGCNAETAKTKPKPKTPVKAPVKKSDFKVIAYYFHGTYRCATCKKLEELSDESIKTGFPKELKDGTLELRAVNVETKGNEHFIDDFKLYTKSLVLVEMVDGKQVKWKNLDKIWELVKDKDSFVKYVQGETKAFLGDAPKKTEKKKTSK